MGCGMDGHDESLEIRTDRLASQRGLDAGRVRGVFHRLLEAGWRTQEFPWLTALDDALAVLPPEEALRLFEEDVPALKRRVAATEYLSADCTPLHTRDELAGLANRFAAHLQRNANHLLLTGHPKTSFAASPFLDWHLTRLNFVKLPLAVQDGRSPFRQARMEKDGLADADGFGNVIYAYSWPRDPAESLYRYPCAGPDGGFVLVQVGDYSWNHGQAVGPNGEPVCTCSYEGAALVPGLHPDDAERLVEMRRGLLDLRIRVLRAISDMVATHRASRVEEACFALIAEALAHEDAQFLLVAEEFYEWLCGTPGIAWSPFRQVSFHNGGLSDLFGVVGHACKEIEVGTMHRTATRLRAATGGSPLTSYYRMSGHPMHASVDAVLDDFLSLDVAEQQFLRDYYGRANDLLANRLGESVDLRMMVERGQSRRFTRMLSSFADFLNAHVEATGRLPEVSLSAVGEEDPTANNTFRRDGDGWAVIFDGTTVHCTNTIGMRYLHMLLAHPNREFGAIELARLVDRAPAVDAPQSAAMRQRALEEEGLIEVDAADAGEIMDERYLSDMRRRIADLDERIQSARLREAAAEEAELEEEKEQLLRFVSQATGLGGRKRSLDDPHERARQRASVNIRRALTAIGKRHPALQEHLRKALKTGYQIAYQPDRPIAWVTD